MSTKSFQEWIEEQLEKDPKLKKKVVDGLAKQYAKLYKATPAPLWGGRHLRAERLSREYIERHPEVKAFIEKYFGPKWDGKIPPDKI